MLYYGYDYLDFSTRSLPSIFNLIVHVGLRLSLLFVSYTGLNSGRYCNRYL